ncbi:MAG: AMP-binding protein [Steroidobacteraceae bacterium]
MHVYDISALEDRVIGKVLTRQAEVIGDHVWLMSGERRVTFAEANRLVNAYAHGLKRQGVQAGQTIALVMYPSIDALLIGFAATRLGAVFTTVNTDYRGEFLSEALRQTQARLLVIDAELADRLAALDLGSIEHVYVHGDDGAASALKPASDLLRHGDAPLPEVATWSDVAQIWWTSGTTGKSKGVMHSHSSVLRMGRENVKPLLAGDVLYTCTPIYLGSPWSGAIWASLVGGVSAAIDRHFSVSQFWDRIRHYRATQFMTLGAMHIHLWRAPPQPNDADNTVRRAICFPMPYDILPLFKERFGIASLPQGYGQSETFQILDAPDDGTKWHGAALGRPVAEYDVKLLDANDREVPVNEVGEICVRPREPGVLFSGYFGMPEMTLATWRSLWHHTGDMATRDENGIFYFADRKKDYIRYKGRNISMNEVEAVVARHPLVLDVAAYGIQSEELESEAELMLAVVLRPDSPVTPFELAHFINENAPYYFVPRYIDLAAELPRNAHGRVIKPELRERGVTASTWDRERAGFKPRK